MTACHRRPLPAVMLGGQPGEETNFPDAWPSSRACGDTTVRPYACKPGMGGISQPFTPEAAIELTNCFWKRTNMMITGTVMTEL